MATIDEDEAHIERSRAPLLEHLRELRGRLFICVAALFFGFFISFVFSSRILEILLRPWDVSAGLMELSSLRGESHGFNLDFLKGLFGLMELPRPRPEFELQVIATGTLETFLAKVKLSAFGALVLTFPVLAWQLYRFVAPGLYRKERLAFAPFLVASPVLFMLGASLVYFILLPFLGYFSLGQQQLGERTIQLLPSVDKHLALSIKLILGFGICFQLPVLVSLLGLAGIVTSSALRSFRRYAILAVAALAAIFTPPDPVSMLSLMIPLVLLYEVSIWVVKLLELRRPKED